MQNLEADAADLLLQVITTAMRGLSAELRGAGENLEPYHFHILAKLHDGRLTLGELAQLSAVSPATMSRTVSTLADRGLVSRAASPQDGRVVLVCLTQQGDQALKAISNLARDWIIEQIHPLSLEKQQTLYEGLQVLREVIQGVGQRK